MRALALTALALVLFVPPMARADRARRPSDGLIADRDELMEAPPSGRGAGSAGAVARMRVPPDPPVVTNDLRAALERARPEMQACLDAAGLRGGTVRARISRDAALRLTIRSRPRDGAAEACVEIAAQRHVTPLLARPISRALSASIRLGSRPRPPVSPPPPSGDGGDREVHSRIDASSGLLRRCLDDAFPGLTGAVTLGVVAHRDGSMVLESASLPPGVPAGPMLVCLQNEVLHLRVSAGSERRVTHALTLGR